MSNAREPVVAGTVAREPRVDRHGTTVAPPREATTDVSAIPPAVSRGDPGSGGKSDPAGPPWWVWFSGLLGLALLLLLAALWPRAPFALDVGMPGDRLFLANVHGDERVAEYSYRWTGKDGGDTILTVPGWGAVRRARLTVRAQALPDRAPIDVQVLANGVPVGTMRVDGTMAAHALEIAIPPGGADLALALRSPTTTVPGDSRQLGVKLDTIRLEPLAYDAGAYWRALGPLLASVLVLVALGLGLTGGLAGAVVWAVRLGVALVVPLAAAVALPLTLAVLPLPRRAAFFALFGVSTAAAKLPNVFIMAALLLLVYRVGAALWSRRVGLLAAALLALQGSLFEGAVYPLNDVGFTFLAFGCLVLLWRLTEV